MSREPLEKLPKFAWPPQIPDGEPAAPPQTTLAVAESKSSRSAERTTWLHDIERDWLGLISRPVLAEFAAVHWSPDSDTDYCPRCGRSVTAFELLPIEDDGEETEERPQGARRDCSTCFRRRLPWNQFVRLGSYDGALREAVLDTKFRRGRTTGHVLGNLLGQSLATRARFESIATDRIVLVPVPMHPWRRLVRGIDHTLTIARGMRQVLPGAQIQRLLRRRGLRPTQVEIAHSSRRANVSKTIVPTSGVQGQSHGRLVVVIDDVRTTGATLGEACRSLRAAFDTRHRNRTDFVRLWAAAVAVSEMATNGQDVVRSGAAVSG